MAAAADERDTSLPASDAAGGPASVAMPARPEPSRGARTMPADATDDPDRIQVPPRFSKTRQAKRTRTSVDREAGADASGAGKKRRHTGGRRPYMEPAQNLLGITQDDIARVAALPDLDLFKRPERRPVGRPTVYDPSYCERLIRLAENGNSITQCAVKLGLDKTTLFVWAEKHPEFKTAMDMATEACKCWWEDMGMIGMVSDKFNTGVWVRSMAARFRDEYVERRQTEIAGEITERREITINARQIEPEAREALKSALLSIKRAVDGDDE